jgi:Fe-S cluster assembly iron-binding protein IscA
VLSLTSDATQAIERILKAPGVPDDAGLRIMPVAPTDESEVTSELQVEVANQPDERDAVIEANGARVFVEDSLCGYLDDKTLDAETDRERIRFSLAGQTAAPETN